MPDEDQREPLQYQSPAEQPPRKPFAWILMTVVGCLLVLLRPRGGNGVVREIADVACLLGGLALVLWGSFRTLRWHGAMLDYQWRLEKRDRATKRE